MLSRFVLARFLPLMLAVLGLMPVAAGADDIAATARGVVRVVTIAMVDDQVAGFGHGSGFAVAPNRIVTNAHVVELAERYPDNVVIGVVPSEGSKSYQGRVIAYDAHRDLALIEVSEAKLPTVALFTGPVTEGDQVIALGYPGNVDLATAQSAADYIRPLSPVRSQGVASGRRALTGIEVLLHTASIARGNSGGPLLDPCGRVIGVNSALTRADDGDSTFGFAIADTELMAFLRAAKQPYTAVGMPCTSIEERLREDSAADARARSPMPPPPGARPPTPPRSVARRRWPPPAPRPSGRGRMSWRSPRCCWSAAHWASARRGCSNRAVGGGPPSGPCRRAGPRSSRRWSCSCCAPPARSRCRPK
ncbi:S1C family serine protease [Sphingomonas sp. SORGH_AS_0950]|uniref:S1C family serine protease n=1 Tax=Sphingomonas sp. SORGH_AS_0950 TaxID=3041792 RepID=UPI0027D7D9C5|nr:trypsin-like peptidase domain-containing protein [Sphingomonas sp. SORGH_AS_0950]